MLRVSLLISFLLLILSPPVNSSCKPSSCGNIGNISFPFRLSGDPQNCGLREYELSCDHNHTILQVHAGKYRVEEIDYASYTLRVVDVGLLNNNNCSAVPLLSFPERDYLYDSTGIIDSYTQPAYEDSYNNTVITLISCATPTILTYYYSATIYMTNDCFFNSTYKYNYVVYGYNLASHLRESCSVEIHLRVSEDKLPSHLFDYMMMPNISFRSIYDAQLYGFYMRCANPFDRGRMPINNTFFRSITRGVVHLFHLSPYDPYNIDYAYDGSTRIQIIAVYLISSAICVAMAIAARSLLLGPFVLAFLVYKWRRRHLSMYDNIEDFIHSHNNLRPVRYSYSDIKKMTNGFKHKLGQGGYGSVFKGTLRSGHLVAVKILNDSKANGQDFINEVATIGRIHHYNVAPLIGFCAERSKRALLYNFMPNGSLEKYIFPREGENIFLSIEQLHAISLGIARGIEYLHQGCEMQILHFDIKPHNILLDENLTPKVSDFGLAKLYPTDDSIVNLTAVRGTMGYMAPELFYKNIGGVSYKSDVYSYGMLLMEMASKRKNSNPQVEHSSQQYFPSWVYDQFCDGKDLEMGDATDEERNIVKRMMIVAFWCIQWKPSDRPSMTKVLEMLEGNGQLLMPPKLFLSLQEVHEEDHGINTDPASEFSTSFEDSSSDTISLIVNSS